MTGAFRTAFLAIFCATGFSAILYQVIWRRLLTLLAGSDEHAVALIVATFMTGLGLGGLAGGSLADRIEGRTRLLALAACEVAIAAFGAISVALFYDVLYAQLVAGELTPAAASWLGAGATLVPTFAMGMTLPLAARAITDDARQPARWVPILYGLNTLGAAAGAHAVSTVLMPRMSFDRVVLVGVVINALTAVAVAAMATARPFITSAPTNRRVEDSRSPAPPPASLWLWLILFAISGFVAMALEVVWFRLLGVILKANTFTFSHLLAVYLGGLGLGALAANTALARRWPAAQSFFLTQAAIPICAVLSLSALVAVLGPFRGMGVLWAHLGDYEGVASDPFSWAGVLLVWLVPMGLMGLPTFLMGVSYGSLQRAVHGDITGLGRRVGWLQAASIAGGATGALATGFVLLDRAGAAATLSLLTVPAGWFLWLWLRSQNQLPRTASALAAGFAIVVTLAAAPGQVRLWTKLHGVAGPPPLIAEDGSGVAVLATRSGTTELMVNGLGQSSLPYGDIHTMLGALPAMLHPSPVRVAVVGLGTGDTVYALGGRVETTRIDSIEIAAPVIAVLREWVRLRPAAGLRELLSDPRVRHHVADGRVFLAGTTERYDIIEADALRPNSPSAGNLYSVEYFSLLRGRLNPGGLAVTWLPTPRVLDTLRSVFPHVLVLDEIGIGSDQPVPFDPADLRRRMAHPFTREHYRAAGLDVETLLAPLLRDRPIVFAPGDARPLPLDLNEDLFPRDEFGVPRAAAAQASRPD